MSVARGKQRCRAQEYRIHNTEYRIHFGPGRASAVNEAQNTEYGIRNTEYRSAPTAAQAANEAQNTDYKYKFNTNFRDLHSC